MSTEIKKVEWKNEDVKIQAKLELGNLNEDVETKITNLESDNTTNKSKISAAETKVSNIEETIKKFIYFGEINTTRENISIKRPDSGTFCYVLLNNKPFSFAENEVGRFITGYYTTYHVSGIFGNISSIKAIACTRNGSAGTNQIVGSEYFQPLICQDIEFRSGWDGINTMNFTLFIPNFKSYQMWNSDGNNVAENPDELDGNRYYLILRFETTGAIDFNVSYNIRMQSIYQNIS